jgi:chemotaxis signal transduction protein
VTALAPATDRVASLRAEFDSVFALPPRDAREEWTDMLAVTVHEDAYAMRLSELAGLYVDKPVTPLPAAGTTVRGLVGFRGAVVVVYDLAALLGAPRAASCRWLVAAADNPAVALAFARFDGHVRASADQIAVAEAGSRSPWREVLHVDGAVRPIVSLSTVLERIVGPAESGRRSNQP